MSSYNFHCRPPSATPRSPGGITIDAVWIGCTCIAHSLHSYIRTITRVQFLTDTRPIMQGNYVADSTAEALWEHATDPNAFSANYHNIRTAFDNDELGMVRMPIYEFLRDNGMSPESAAEVVMNPDNKHLTATAAADRTLHQELENMSIGMCPQAPQFTQVHCIQHNNTYTLSSYRLYLNKTSHVIQRHTCRPFPPPRGPGHPHPWKTPAVMMTAARYGMTHFQAPYTASLKCP